MSGFSMGNVGAAISGAVGGAIQGAINGFKDALGGAADNAAGLDAADFSLSSSDEGINGASIMGEQDGTMALAGNKTVADMAAEMGSLFDTGVTSQQEDDEVSLKSAIDWAGHEVRIDYDGDGIWDVIKFVSDSSMIKSPSEQSEQSEQEE